MTHVGGSTASAQQSAPSSADTSRRYVWLNAGVGGGRTGVGPSVSAGAPVTDRFYGGIRYIHTTELEILGSGPSGVTWAATGIVGLFKQGRWGHLSLASGIAVVGGRRPHDRDAKPSTLGFPVDAQAYFTPLRYVGFGVHGYANVNPGDNLLGCSVELQVRIPYP